MIARLIESRELAPEVRHFTFEAPEAPALAYQPGQFVSVTSELHGKQVTRAYSVASAPSGNRFELCLNRVKDGLLSPWMFELSPGGEIAMNGPLGYFVPRQPFRPAVFVATGTGIAPFRAFLQHASVLESGEPVSLLFGARYEEGLLYRHEFEALKSSMPGFRFLPTITRPGPAWQGRTGWVQQHLEEALDGRTGVDVYICGLKAMVDAVRAALKEKGFDRKQIVYEKYD
jgi:ferredoxin-NADP reductase